MRRTLLLTLFVAVSLTSSASAAGVDTTTRPPLQAALAACSTGATEQERFAIFTGSMPARRATRRMWMRFDLQTLSAAGASWERVQAPEFGRWEKSDLLRAGFVWTKRVEALREGAGYRAVVRFRWYGRGGRVQAERRRITPVCRQPDLRPDLAVEKVAPVAGGDARYAVSVVNDGLTAAGPFAVAVAGGATREVAGLAAGERTTVEVAGPRCAPGEAVVVTVDPGETVDEADEADNGFRRLC